MSPKHRDGQGRVVQSKIVMRGAQSETGTQLYEIEVTARAPACSRDT
jgi:hypothetical protein